MAKAIEQRLMADAAGVRGVQCAVARIARASGAAADWQCRGAATSHHARFRCSKAYMLIRAQSTCSHRHRTHAHDRRVYIQKNSAGGNQ